MRRIRPARFQLASPAENAATWSRWRFGLRLGLGMLLLCGSLSGCTWFRSMVGHCPEKSHRLAEQAHLAEEAGDIPSAVAFFDAALKETPNDPHLHREMARLLLALNQQRMAMEHLEAAVEHNPDDVEANVELAELYIENHEAWHAKEHLDVALQNDPKHLTALLLRAKLAEVLDDLQTALETYHRILSLEPKHVEARMRIALLQLKNKQPNLSAPILRSICQCARAAPDEIAEARWALGIAYGQEHRWADAVDSLLAATEHQTDFSADDWYRLAYARGQLEDWEGARQDLDRALQINPRHANAQAMLGVLSDQPQTPGTPILRIGHTVKPIPRPDLW